MAADRLARVRGRIRGVGGWRLAYEISLGLVLTVLVTITAASDAEYPAAPVLIAVSIPVIWVLRLVNPLGAYLAAAVIGMCTGGENALFLSVLSASFSYRTGRWRHLIAGAATAWAGLLAAEAWWGDGLDLETVVLLTAIFAMVALLPAGIARIVRRQRTLLAAMHRRNQQLYSQQSELTRQAQARERTRIARDLHDSLGHKLTLISLYAGMLRTPGQDTQASADLLRDTSSAAMTELRQILGILRQDDEQSVVRPLSGLDELATNARASGVPVRLVQEGESRPLATLTEHAAYRVIQEGVTNALRHAHGGEIVMSLRYEPDALVASVANTAGRRVVRVTSGQGLLGLAERVRLAGGVLHSGRTPDGGFRLAATLPYPAADSPAEPAGGEPGPMAPPAADADFAHLMDRNRRRSRLLLMAGTLAIGALLALCVAGASISMTLISVDRETYDAVRVGEPESEVRPRLPDEEAGTVNGNGGRQVPGANCIDYQGSILEQLRAEEGNLTYRFCFRDGRLADKQTFFDQ